MESVTPRTEVILSRRHFLKTTALLGTALVVEVSLPGCSTTPATTLNNETWTANAWLSISENNHISFVLDRVEMGQGTMTGLTTLIAEELGVDPGCIDVMAARADRRYANPAYGVQLTGGSTSMSTSFLPLRRAAAALRMAMTEAAARRWSTTPAEITVQSGRLLHGENSATYGDLVQEAAQIGLPADDKIVLKDAASFRYIGKAGPRLDAQMKVMGTGTFGIDVQRPVLYKAALKRCPIPGGTVKSWKDTGATKRKGIKRVVAIDTGVAVVAENWWQAQQALAMIEIEWENTELHTLNTAKIYEQFQHAARHESGKSIRSDGAGESGLEKASSVIEAEYRAPYLAHATMEPMNCTVQLSADFCEIWAPTQGPDVVANWAERITGLPRRKIEVHTTLIGGGFGRRLTQDFAIEAVKIAKASGLPVQLIWSRTDDLQHDVYRPAALARMKAGFDNQKQPMTCAHRIVTPSIMSSALGHLAGAVLPDSAPEWAANMVGGLGPLYGSVLADPSSTEGAADTPYQFPNFEVRHIGFNPGVPVGYWRSVGHSFNAFFMEGFMDEMAHHAGQDPLQFRQALLHKHPRMQTVLTTLAEKARWGAPASGRYQGLAAHHSFGSYVAQVAEISVDNGEIRVHHVTCVVDCGLAINPDVVVAQMEGGIMFGLSAALFGEVTHADGSVQQASFNDYRLLRAQQAPSVEVIIINSNEAPSGVGEPGVPPIAPAVANAVFAATGKRLRSLPLRLEA